MIFLKSIIFRQISVFNLKMGPKKKSGNNSVENKSVAAEEKLPVTQNFKDGNFSISLNVKPGSKIDSITDISEDFVSIQISAPPMDNEANLAIIKYFSKLLNVKKSDIDLKGAKSRQKTLVIQQPGNLTVKSILDIIKKEAENSSL